MLDYLVPLIENWPDRDTKEDPLSLVDLVEVSVAYECHIRQPDLVQYIHMNR